MDIVETINRFVRYSVAFILFVLAILIMIGLLVWQERAQLLPIHTHVLIATLVVSFICFLILLVIFLYYAKRIVKNVLEKQCVEKQDLEDIVRQRSQALHESEASYRLLTEHSVSAIAVHDIVLDDLGKPVDYVFLSINKSFEVYTGLQMADVIGRRVTEILPGIERTSFIEIYGRVALTGEPISFEQYVEQLNRHYFINAYRVGEGRFATVFTDITEMREVENAIRESQERLRLLSDNIPKGMVYQIDSGVDGTSRIFTYVSAGVERLHGVTAAEVMKDSSLIYGQLVEEDRHIIAEREASSVAQMLVFRSEYRAKLPSGELRYFLVTSRPRRLANNHLIWDGFEIDITDLKLAEQENDKLQAQLIQAQKMESVGRLAGGVAHDFNNMLGVIIGHADVALEHVDLENPLHANLEEIRNAAKRSSDLTLQLLAFARKQTISPKELDLNVSIESTLRMLQRLIGEDISLLWMPGENLWKIKIDPTQLDQILANLCVNAKDAITTFGKITIETANCILNEEYCANNADFVPGEYVILSVSDNGCGMDCETLTHVFEPFFTTKDIGSGTGLGLATVYGVVKQNNGFINVYSELDNGTTFKVYFPRYFERFSATLDKASVQVPTKGCETILLVEDEPAILRITKIMLERLGYNVIIANTSSAAISLASEYDGEIHLLMTDVVMPDMNGRDLAKTILSCAPNIKQLFISGYTANVIANHGVLDEGMYFLQKPFSMNCLAAKIRAVLDSP